MSSSFGKLIRVTIFGQSHSQAIGVVIDGLPAGERVDLERVGRFMQRRAPGRSSLSTARREPDLPRVLSGLLDGVTCGAPVCAVIENTDARPADYEALRDIPRPMHADFTAAVKYRGANDMRGGGQFSGRLTAPLCFAGAVCLQILERRGIAVGARLAQIERECDAPLDAASATARQILAIAQKDFPVSDDAAGGRMKTAIERARAEGDAVGGVVECLAVGLPAGIGEPIYEGLESRLAAVLFSIPAVKGLEFGAGFAAAALRASAHNDAFAVRDGRIVTQTNRHGGILGGISTGMPLVLRAAFKPTPSIAVAQRSVRLSSREETQLTIAGRHDPCVAVRAVACVEAAVAVVLLDLMLESKGRDQWSCNN
jgi:chorismate synthase